MQTKKKKEETIMSFSLEEVEEIIKEVKGIEFHQCYYMVVKNDLEFVSCGHKIICSVLIDYWNRKCNDTFINSLWVLPFFFVASELITRINELLFLLAPEDAKKINEFNSFLQYIESKKDRMVGLPNDDCISNDDINKYYEHLKEFDSIITNYKYFEKIKDAGIIFTYSRFLQYCLNREWEKD
jgi:hypothetical protein